jgi:hypothetical protein
MNVAAPPQLLQLMPCSGVEGGAKWWGPEATRPSVDALACAACVASCFVSYQSAAG